VALGAGSAWVTASGSGTVVRISTATGRVQKTIRAGVQPRDVAFALGAVWVTDPIQGSVIRISPKTNRVVKTIRPLLSRLTSMPIADDRIFAAYKRGRDAHPERSSEVMFNVYKYLAKELELPASDTTCDAFQLAVLRWQPFSDSVEALKRLRTKFRLVAMTNADRVALSAAWRTLEGRALFGMLDDVELTPAQDSITGLRSILYHRFLAGHILTWRPSRRFELSLGETLLFSRQGGAVDLGFVNPLMPLVVTQNDPARSGTSVVDNLTVYGAARFRPGPATITTELLVDDIQIDAADRRRTPDQLGWRLHGAIPVPSPLPLLTVEAVAAVAAPEPGCQVEHGERHQ